MSTPQKPSPALVRAAMTLPAQKHNLTPEEENAWIAHYRDRGMTASTDAAILRDHIQATAQAMREKRQYPGTSKKGNCVLLRTLRRWTDRLEGKE